MKSQNLNKTYRERLLSEKQIGFNPSRLSEWIELCEKADVPFIPSFHLLSFDLERFLSIEPSDSDIDYINSIEDAINSISYSVPFKSMVRYNSFSPHRLKYNMNTGSSSHEPYFNSIGFIKDPFARDEMYNYPYEIMEVFLRHWIRPIIINDYPLEFRVFVEDDNIKGISSYYINRSLDLGEPFILESITECVKLTNKLIEHQKKPLHLPQARALHNDDKNSWSVDFMHSLDKGIILIDGNPPFGLGVNPCCFGINKNPSGIKLSL